MILVYLFLILTLGYGLLLILPKGNLLQEIGQLPIYLYKVKKVPLDGLTSQKFAFGNHRRQYFLLYQSEKTIDSNKPIVIYFHGGGWTFGSPEQFAPNAKFFADLGHPVIMPSYRRLPFYRSSAIADDRSLALQKIDEVLSAKNWQDRKIILGGLSAGANVAALLYFDRKNLERLNFDRSRFAGIMLHGAPVDISQMSPTPLLYCYAGFPNAPSFAEANPISYLLEKEHIPILMIHGTRDGMVSYRCAESFRKRCEELEYEQFHFHTLTEGTHLDAGSWVFKSNKSAELIKSWLATTAV